MDLVEQFSAAFQPVLRGMRLLTRYAAVVRRLQTIAFEQYALLATLAAFMVHIFCRVLPPRLGGGVLFWRVPGAKFAPKCGGLFVGFFFWSFGHHWLSKMLADMHMEEDSEPGSDQHCTLPSFAREHCVAWR